MWFVLGVLLGWLLLPRPKWVEAGAAWIWAWLASKFWWV